MVKLGTEKRQTHLTREAALAGIRQVANSHRRGLVTTLSDEGPSVIGCKDGFLIMFVQQDALRVDKYDQRSNRVARYRL